VQAGGDVLAEPRREVFARRAKRRIPIAVGATVIVVFASALLPGTEATARDAAAAAAWAVVIGAVVGVLVSLPTPQGRWWRWTAPTLAAIASLPLLLAAEVVLWFAGGGELGFFGEPNQPADAGWYPFTAAAVASAWLVAMLLGYSLAEQRRRFAFAPLAVAAASLVVLALLVSVT